VGLEEDARAVVQTMVAWLTEQGLEGRDVPAMARGLGQRLRESRLPVDRVGCATLALHPQIMSEEVAWDTESDDARTTLYTSDMMEASENRSGPYFQLALNGITYARFPIGGANGAPEGSLLKRLGREGYTDYFAFFTRPAAAWKSRPSRVASVLSPASLVLSLRADQAASPTSRSNV